MRNRDVDRPAFTLLELLVVLAIIAVLLGLLLPAIQRVRDASLRSYCQNNLRQIGLAVQQYHDTYRVFPPAVRTGDDPYPFLTWQARLLPWLEQAALWGEAQRAFQTDSRFWMPTHNSVRTTPLTIFICPADGRTIGNPSPGKRAAAFTHYLGVSGNKSGDGLLYEDASLRLANVRDGTSQTLLAGERPPSADERFGWWYAGIGQNYDGTVDSHLSVRQRNQTFRAPMCSKGPYQFKPGDADNLCDMFHFWSLHIGGASFLFADGSVRFLDYSADGILPALATRAGGEVVQLP